MDKLCVLSVEACWPKFKGFFFFFFVIGKSYLDYGLLNVEFWTTYSGSFLTNQSRSSIPIRKC